MLNSASVIFHWVVYAAALRLFSTLITVPVSLSSYIRSPVPHIMWNNATHSFTVNLPIFVFHKDMLAQRYSKTSVFSVPIILY